MCINQKRRDRNPNSESPGVWNHSRSRVSPSGFQADRQTTNDTNNTKGKTQKEREIVREAATPTAVASSPEGEITDDFVFLET